MTGTRDGDGWCHWHHATAGTVRPIAVAPVVGGEDLHACAECRATYGLVPAAGIPAEVWAAATDARPPARAPGAHRG